MMAEKRKKRINWYFTPLFLGLFLLFSICGMMNPHIVKAEGENTDETEILETPEGSYTPEASFLT